MIISHLLTFITLYVLVLNEDAEKAFINQVTFNQKITNRNQHGLCGGLPLQIDLAGFFSNDSHQVLINDKECVIDANLTIDSRIKCKTPPNPPGFYPVTVYINGQQAQCPIPSNCQVEYRTELTPTLYEAIPKVNQGLKSQQFYATTRKSGQDSSFDEMWIGDQRCSKIEGERTDQQDNDDWIRGNDKMFVSCITPDVKPFSGRPNLIIPEVGETCHYFHSGWVDYNYEYITHKLLPKILLVKNASGSTRGGNVITIQGSGFNVLPENNRVLVGNRECKVTSSYSKRGSDFLECEVSLDTVEPSVNPLHGNVGMIYSISNRFNPLIKQRQDATLLTSESSPDPLIRDHYQMEANSYFLPPRKGMYKFYMLGDDRHEFTLTDEDSGETIASQVRLGATQSMDNSLGLNNPSYWTEEVELDPAKNQSLQMKHWEQSGEAQVKLGMIAPNSGLADPNASMKEKVSIHLNYRSIQTVYKLSLLGFEDVNGVQEQMVFLDLTSGDESFFDKFGSDQYHYSLTHYYGEDNEVLTYTSANPMSASRVKNILQRYGYENYHVIRQAVDQLGRPLQCATHTFNLEQEEKCDVDPWAIRNQFLGVTYTDVRQLSADVDLNCADAVEAADLAAKVQGQAQFIVMKNAVGANSPNMNFITNNETPFEYFNNSKSGQDKLNLDQDKQKIRLQKLNINNEYMYSHCQVDEGNGYGYGYGYLGQPQYFNQPQTEVVECPELEYLKHPVLMAESAPVTGNFKIVQQGKSSNWIDIAQMDEDSLLSELYQLDEDFLQVELALLNNTNYSRTGVLLTLLGPAFVGDLPVDFITFEIADVMGSTINGGRTDCTLDSRMILNEVQKGQNQLFFPAIPEYMLKTKQADSVKVFVKNEDYKEVTNRPEGDYQQLDQGFEAACELNSWCKYNFVEDWGEIIDFSLDSETNILSITITNEITKADGTVVEVIPEGVTPSKIEVGTGICATPYNVSQNSANQAIVTCTYDEMQTQAGSWFPEVFMNGFGRLQHNCPDCTLIEKTIIVDSQTNEGSMMGGTPVVIVGSGFTETGLNVGITIDGKPCSITETTYLQLTCISPPAAIPQSEGATHDADLIVEVQNDYNGETKQIVKSFTYTSASTPLLTSFSNGTQSMEVTPYQLIPIVFNTDNMGIHDIEDITVYIGNEEQGMQECTTKLYTSNQLTVLYFVSGVGEMKVEFKVLGSNSLGAGQSSLLLVSNFIIHDFFPKEGSRFGGTLITIKGEGFPEGENDRTMSVNIMNVAWCQIEGEIKQNEFKCRVQDMELPVSADKEAELLVMLRVTLFASCSNCSYKFTNEATPEVATNQIFEGGCMKIQAFVSLHHGGTWKAVVGGHKYSIEYSRHNFADDDDIYIYPQYQKPRETHQDSSLYNLYGYNSGSQEEGKKYENDISFEFCPEDHKLIPGGVQEVTLQNDDYGNSPFSNSQVTFIQINYQSKVTSLKYFNGYEIPQLLKLPSKGNQFLIDGSGFTENTHVQLNAEMKLDIVYRSASEMYVYVPYSLDNTSYILNVQDDKYKVKEFLYESPMTIQVDHSIDLVIESQEIMTNGTDIKYTISQESQDKQNFISVIHANVSGEEPYSFSMVDREITLSFESIPKMIDLIPEITVTALQNDILLENSQPAILQYILDQDTAAIRQREGNDLAESCYSDQSTKTLNDSCIFMDNTTSSQAGLATVVISNAQDQDPFLSVKNQVKVEVCGVPATVISASNSSIIFETPHLDTSMTISAIPPLSKEFGAEFYFGDQTSELEKLTTNDQSLIYSCESSDCQVGVRALSGWKLHLEKFMFFAAPQMSEDNSQSVGMGQFNNSRVQQSDEGNGWDDLKIFSKLELFEGWNDFVPVDSNEHQEFRFKMNDYRSRLAGIKFVGYMFKPETSDDITCPVLLYNSNFKPIGEDRLASYSTVGSISYNFDNTPTITSITPKFGSHLGGEEVTLVGTLLESVTEVTFDGITCAISTPTNCVDGTCTFTCISGEKDEISLTQWYEPVGGSNVIVKTSVYGAAAMNGLKYEQIERWSSTTTWGGLAPPQDGESVWIPPGMKVLVDVSTAKIDLLTVEGELRFENEDKQIDMSVRQFLINKGKFMVGTESEPFIGKANIKLWGDKYDKQTPMFGSKMMGVQGGYVGMFGVKPSHSWTRLAATADLGDVAIVVEGEVDWQAGGHVVIASTGFDHFESEKKVIQSVSQPGDGTSIITLESILEFQHIGVTQSQTPKNGADTDNTRSIDMRAEVGYLPRNITVFGDEQSKEQEFGCHVLVAMPGSVGQFEGVEFHTCGQMGQLGRYTVHFHRLGNAVDSFVKFSSMQEGFNRASTIHGTRNLLYEDNFAYLIKGHNFFIEDGVEESNRVQRNCGVSTLRSWSLLNTDQTPATFWITNPNNQFTDNAAGGSDRYGFWFDLDDNPMETFIGVSDVHPNGTKLGAFSNNSAHSNGRQGLRIFHGLIPRTCSGCSIKNDNLEDEFSQNEPIEALFLNFTGYKNNRNCAISENTGELVFQNFRCADNKLAGIEFSDAGFSRKVLVKDAMIIGNSGLGTEDLGQEHRGFIGPGVGDNVVLDGVHFQNFADEGGKNAAFSTCSHCFHPAATHAGGTYYTTLNLNLVWLENGVLTQEDSVEKFIHWEYPFREYIKDSDGTLTGQFASVIDSSLTEGGWAAPNYKHLSKPGSCIYEGATTDDTTQQTQKNNIDKYSLNKTEGMFKSYESQVVKGLICNNSVTMRTMQVWGAQPFNTHLGSDMQLMRDDECDMEGVCSVTYEERADVLADVSNYTIHLQKDKGGPGFSWTIPVFIDHNYFIYLGRNNNGVQTINDFTTINVKIGREWDKIYDSAQQLTGDQIVLKWYYLETREHQEVKRVQDSWREPQEFSYETNLNGDIDYDKFQSKTWTYSPYDEEGVKDESAPSITTSTHKLGFWFNDVDNKQFMMRMIRDSTKINNRVYIEGYNCQGEKCKEVCLDCLVGDYEFHWRNWHNFADWTQEMFLEGQLIETGFAGPGENDIIEIKAGQKMIVTQDVTTCVKRLVVTGILIIDPTQSETKSLKFCAQVVQARGGRIIVAKYRHDATSISAKEEDNRINDGDTTLSIEDGNYQPIPDDQDVTISFMGSMDDDNQLAVDDSVDQINKGALITNNVLFLGAPRDTVLTHLSESVFEGSKTLKTDECLDFSTNTNLNHQISVSPGEFENTNFNGDSLSEKIKSSIYEVDVLNSTCVGGEGIVKILDEAGFERDHIKPITDFEDSALNSINFSPEVVYLTRNVKFTAFDQPNDTWKCTIYLTQFDDLFMDGGQIISEKRRAQGTISSIEVDNCGQAERQRGSITMKNLDEHAPLTISKSSFLNSDTQAILILNSKRITFTHNIVINQVKSGIWTDKSHDFTLSNNIVINTNKRLLNSSMVTEINASQCICCETSMEACTGMTITNNIGVGSDEYGLMIKFNDCSASASDSTQITVENHIQHHSQYGIVDTSNASFCVHIKGAISYLNQLYGAGTYSNHKQVKISEMVLVANSTNLYSLNGVYSCKDGENCFKVPYYHELDDIKIAGNFNARCSKQKKEKNTCNAWECKSKIGVLTPGASTGAKAYPTAQSSLPLPKVKSESLGGSQAELKNSSFENFYQQDLNSCGKQESDRVIQDNDTISDMVMPLQTSNLSYQNIDGEVVSKLDVKTKTGWVDISNCGNFPCTGQYNFPVVDEDGSLLRTRFNQTTSSLLVEDSGSTLPFVTTSNGAIAYTKDTGHMKPGCFVNNEMNAYLCHRDTSNQKNQGQVMFEDLTRLRMDRSFSPITISQVQDPINQVDQFTSPSFSFENNNFQDHTWDGFYTGQKRLNRFPMIIQYYRMQEIESVGSFPDQMRFTTIPKISSDEWVLVKVKMRTAKMIKVKVLNRTTKLYDDFDSVEYDHVTNTHRKLQETQYINSFACGYNQQDKDEQSIQFVLKGNCELLLKLIEVVQVNTRLNMDFDSFMSTDGPTNFIDNMSSFLNINPAQIKIAKIQRGSVVIDFVVLPENEPADPSSEDTTPITVTSQEDAADPVVADQAVADEVPAEYDDDVINGTFEELTRINDTISNATAESLSADLGFEVDTISSEVTQAEPDNWEPVIPPGGDGDISNNDNQIEIIIMTSVIFGLIIVGGVVWQLFFSSNKNLVDVEQNYLRDMSDPSSEVNPNHKYEKMNDEFEKKHKVKIPVKQFEKQDIYNDDSAENDQSELSEEN